MIETPLWFLITLVQFGIFMLAGAVVFWVKYRKADRCAKQLGARLLQQVGQSTTHKLRIAELEVQLESLNTFEAMYFELEAEHRKLQVLQDEFQQQACALLCDADQARLKQSLDELQGQKQLLENKLKSVQDALEEILAKQADSENAALSGVDVLNTSARVEAEINAIRDVITHQKELITHLNAQVNHLQIEVSDKQQLEALLQSLEAQNQSMTASLAGMQAENTRLKDQVRGLQVQERAQINDNAQEMQQLREALAQRDAAYAELEKRYITIETEYQRIYAKTQNLQA